MNSTSGRFPNGMGNDSGELGHNLMDHNYRGGVWGVHEGFKDQYYYGRRPTGVYLPRFRNVGKDHQQDFVRGYAYAVFGSRGRGDVPAGAHIGGDFKDGLSEAGNWQINMTGMGECLPYHDNKVSLSKSEKDDWGIPLLESDCMYRANEEAMLKDLLQSGLEMLDKAGFKQKGSYDTQQAPGLGIHEMGTARMGRDPKTSVLNGNNQVWGASNVFVTDGACMTSAACQNPSLTYMALTARAADYAVRAMKKNEL